MMIKLKRINRGVVLAIITAVVFIICIAVGNSSFKKHESEQIKKVIEDYTQQMSVCSVAEEGANGQAPEDFAQHSSQQARKVIADYWEESEYLDNYNEGNIFSEYYYYLKGDMINDIGYASDCFSPNDYVTSVTSTVSIESVRKNGPNGATVRFGVVYKVCGVGEPGIYTIAGLNSVYSPLSKDTPSTYYAYNVTAELYKDDGQWKVIGIDWYGLSGEGGMYDYY